MIHSGKTFFHISIKCQLLKTQKSGGEGGRFDISLSVIDYSKRIIAKEKPYFEHFSFSKQHFMQAKRAETIVWKTIQYI